MWGAGSVPGAWRHRPHGAETPPRTPSLHPWYSAMAAHFLHAKSVLVLFFQPPHLQCSVQGGQGGGDEAKEPPCLTSISAPLCPARAPVTCSAGCPGSTGDGGVCSLLQDWGQGKLQGPRSCGMGRKAPASTFYLPPLSAAMREALQREGEGKHVNPQIAWTVPFPMGSVQVFGFSSGEEGPGRARVRASGPLSGCTGGTRLSLVPCGCTGAGSTTQAPQSSWGSPGV